MGYSAFARVLTGWTGSMVIDGVTIAPRTRESVCSMFARAVHDCAITGRLLTVAISSTGIITISSDSNFDCTFTSNTATRTGFTSTYTGASSYTAAGAYSTAYVPANGLRVNGVMLATTRGGVVGDGSGAGAPRRTSRSTTITVWDSQLTLPDFADYDWDVWHGGRWFGRFVVTGLRREPMGRLRAVTNVTTTLDVAEVSAGEVVQTPVPWSEQPNAVAFLLGYVRCDAAGYRDFEYEGVVTSVTHEDFRFDAYVTECNTVCSLAFIDPQLTWDQRGRVNGLGYSAIGDRFGWLLGYGVEAGVSFSFDQTYTFVPPAGIPLLGCSWTRVESDADRRVIIDEALRNQGYSWGGALLWRCTMTMSHYAVEALQTGWCLAGKVTLGTVSKLTADEPVSLSDPQGYITGYVVGDPTISWRDNPQTVAVVELTIATE